MAKRIKIKGNPPRIKNRPPRGLSKAERVMSNAEDQNYRRGGDPGIFGGQLTSRELIEAMRLGRGATRPSSTRKKLVKPGNPKFTGRRPLKSELREDADTRWRELNSEFLPAASMSQEDLQIEAASARAARNNRGKKLPRLRGQKGIKKLRAQDENFGQVEGPKFGIGGISKNQRLKALLSKLMDKYYELDF